MGRPLRVFLYEIYTQRYETNSMIDKKNVMIRSPYIKSSF